jgi:hypothetical protein
VADWDNLGQEDTEPARGHSEVLVRLPAGYTDEWKWDALRDDADWSVAAWAWSTG